MTIKKEPFELCLHFTRDSGGDRTYVDLPTEPLKYQRHFPGGTVSIAEFPWHSKKIINGLAELRKDPPSESVLAELGDELWAFLRACGAASSLEEAWRNEQPIRITLLSAAAELYALPWELLRINAGLTLAQLNDCTIRYTWTSEAAKTAVEDYGPSPEGGRILFAWSHGDDEEVPWKSHLREIENACAKIAADERTRIQFFDPQKDVLPHASYQAIKNKLARAAEKDENGETRPYRIVHLLCHGAELERSKGLGLLLTSDDGTALENLDNTSLEKKTLSPDKLLTLFPKGASGPRLVVLCACLGSDSGQPDTRLGSVALATHRAGVESVIASRFLLSKGGSITLCKTLYSSLLGGPSSVEVALSAARAELSDSTDHAALQLYQNTTGWDTRPAIFRPYRGLLTFGLEHQRYFFGREAAVKETIDDLGSLIKGCLDENGNPRARFLIVAAASGTGKSSLVFAGVLPRLMKTYGFAWDTMRAVADPMATLDAVLTRRSDSSNPFLLIVDQFEEVFTQIEKPQQRTEFVRALWQHAGGDSGISVIITLRVDFLGRCNEIVLDEKTGLRLEGLAYDEAHRVFVGQMDRNALREVIEKPAKLVGIGFDEGLVNKVIEEAGHEPGALPLVEYTLDQLWQKREWKNGGEVLTWRAYNGTDGTDRTNRTEGTDGLGGVTGALAKKADSILASFDGTGKRAAQRLLVQLVDMRDDATLDTRKRLRREELRADRGVDEAIFNNVLEKFTSERLIVIGKDEGANANSSVVEIAHEQLVRSWGTLRAWLNNDRQRVLECAPLDEWVKTAGKSNEFLLQGDWLAQARALRDKYRNELDAEAIALITRSEAEEARKARSRRLAATAIAAAAVFMGVLAVVAWGQRQEAKEQATAAASASVQATRSEKEAKESARRARDNALMAGAREFLTAGPPGPAAVLLAEVREPEKARGWFELATSALQSGGVEVTLPHDSPVKRAAWSPDGKRIVAVSGHNAWVWNADGSGKPKVLEGQMGDDLSAVWSPDGKRIVLFTGYHVWVRNADGSGKPQEPGVRFLGAHSASWSSDSTRIVFASFAESTAWVWNIDRSSEPLILGHEGTVGSAAWSPDGTRIVTRSFDDIARVWNADGSGTPVILKGHQSYIAYAAWSPDGTRIATVSNDNTARVWNADGSGKPLVLTHHNDNGKVLSAAWHPDGKRIVTISNDSVVSVWNVDDETVDYVIEGTERVVSASFSPDGTRLLTASVDGTVRILTADGGGGRRVVIKTSWKMLNDAVWSPDSTRILTASDDKTVRVWNADGSGNPLMFNDEKLRGAFSWSPDGKRILTQLRRVARISSADGSGDAVELHDDDGFYDTYWSYDGEHIFALSNLMTARMWNADGSGKPTVLELKAEERDDRSLGHVLRSPDGKRIFTTSGNKSDQQARVWNADGTAEPTVLELNQDSRLLPDASWSPDSKRIAVASSDNTVRIWNPDDSPVPVVLKGHTNRISALTWSPDGTRVVTASRDTTARVWNANGQGKPGVLSEHGGIVWDATWSPDGSRIVTACDDKIARVWNADGSGAPVLLRGHETGVFSAIWSPDGKRILTGSDDGTARVWNADGSGAPWAIEASRNVSWSLDGTRVLIGSGTHQARSYLVDISLLQEALRRATTDCLTPDQRQTYLAETDAEARAGYDVCERAHGRKPAVDADKAP